MIKVDVIRAQRLGRLLYSSKQRIDEVEFQLKDQIELLKNQKGKQKLRRKYKKYLRSVVKQKRQLAKLDNNHKELNKTIDARNLYEAYYHNQDNLTTDMDKTIAKATDKLWKKINRFSRGLNSQVNNMYQTLYDNGGDSRLDEVPLAPYRDDEEARTEVDPIYGRVDMDAIRRQQADTEYEQFPDFGNDINSEYGSVPQGDPRSQYGVIPTGIDQDNPPSQYGSIPRGDPRPTRSAKGPAAAVKSEYVNIDEVLEQARKTKPD